MKVLIIHQHFNTPSGGGAIRSWYLAKALVARGVETVVITAHNARGHRKATVDGINIHYVPVAYANSFGFYRRVISFYRFVWKAVSVARQHPDANLCYAISTPLTTGLAARIIQQRYGIPYLFEVGDLWPDAPIDMGFIRNPLVKRLLYTMEQRIYSRATSVIALSAPIRDAVLKKIPGKVVHVLPNMSDTDYFKLEAKRPDLIDKFAVRGEFVVSYIGSVGIANGLRFFVDCAAECERARLPVRFILCGEGAMKVELENYAATLGLSNLTFLSFRNREGVREVINITDANFVSYLPFKILETGSPNKYFEGLAAGKLTIVNFGGWIRDEIDVQKCGIYVDPGNPGDFVGKIKPFIEDVVLLRSYQHAGRALAERRYARQHLSEKFHSIAMAPSLLTPPKIS